jgi:hypothetical protein
VPDTIGAVCVPLATSVAAGVMAEIVPVTAPAFIERRCAAAVPVEIGDAASSI